MTWILIQITLGLFDEETDLSISPLVTAYCWHVNCNSQVVSCVPEVLRDIWESGDVFLLLPPQHLGLPPLGPPPPTWEAEHAKDSNTRYLGIWSPCLCQGTLCKQVIRWNTQQFWSFTQEARVRASANDQIVRFACPNVLQGEDAPVPVLVASPDWLDFLASLGESEHLAARLVCAQPQGVAVGGEGWCGAGVTWLGASAKWDREVESEVDCVANLPDNCYKLIKDMGDSPNEGLRYYSKCDSLQMLEMEQPVVRRSLGAGRDVGCGGSSGTT